MIFPDMPTLNTIKQISKIWIFKSIEIKKTD